MPHQTKIATCSYCGRRQTLQVTARDGHELACGACGAPLHEMKWLKAPEPEAKAKKSKPMQAPHGFAPQREDWRGGKDWQGGRDDSYRRKKKKKRKSLFKKAFEEAFDVIEDIFD